MIGWMLVFVSIAAATTWLARRYALARNLVDEPGERRSHAAATPRGGGVAIVLALLVAAAALALRFPLEALRLALFSAGLALVAGIGLVDDHRPLAPWVRLAVHGVAALLLAAAVGLYSGSFWLGTVAFAGTLVLTNVWNFMDGINGIAATQAVLVGIAVALLTAGAWSWLALALSAACLGFLPFNFPRARIFLGDVGSGAIGFVLAALLFLMVEVRPSFWPLALLLPSAFLVDAGLTLVRRMLRGERWWTPHTQHAYQVAARRFGHTRVTLAYGAITAIMCSLAVTVATASIGTKLVLLIGSALALAAVWRSIQRPERHTD